MVFCVRASLFQGVTQGRVSGLFCLGVLKYLNQTILSSNSIAICEWSMKYSVLGISRYSQVLHIYMYYNLMEWPWFILQRNTNPSSPSSLLKIKKGKKTDFFLPVILSESLNNQWVTVLTLAWGSSRWGVRSLSKYCWTNAGQMASHPFHLVKSSGTRAASGWGASSVPTQEALNARGLWVLESCGVSLTLAQHHPWRWSVSHQDHKPPWTSLVCYI